MFIVVFPKQPATLYLMNNIHSNKQNYYITFTHLHIQHALLQTI